MKRVLHPSGKDIIFDAKWHQYKLDSTALRSVSKLLDGYFPFDEKRILELVSKKTGEPVDVIKAGWNRQALLGKNIHEYIECKLLDKPPPAFMLLIENRKKREALKPSDATGPSDSSSRDSIELEVLHGEEQLYIPVADAAVDKVKSAYDILAVEQVIASPEWGLAGTIDLVARNRETNRILIGDWKTSGSVVSSFRFGSFETPCGGCLRHLPNSKFYRYALQVMAYSAILRQQKYFENGFFDAPLIKSIGSSNGTLANASSSASAKKSKKKNGTKKMADKSDGGDGDLLGRYRSGELLDHFEYGIVQMSKNEEGGVVVEYKEVTEATVLPPDGKETSFMALLQDVMEGK